MRRTGRAIGGMPPDMAEPGRHTRIVTHTPPPAGMVKTAGDATPYCRKSYGLKLFRMRSRSPPHSDKTS